MEESLKTSVEIERGRVGAEGVLGRSKVWDTSREDPLSSGRRGDRSKEWW